MRVDCQFAVSFFCVLENTLSSLGCDGDVTWLSCNDSKVIRVKSVMYGRSDNVTCTSNISQTTGKCESGTALSTLSPLCNGKQSCVLIPSTDLFGDACSGMSKYADVTYTCTG
jgi:hypothetical protein